MAASRRGSGKVPLLQLLCRKFPELTREELYARLLCGEVRVGSGIEKDPKALVNPAADISFVFRRYVSRGGEKLESAFKNLQFPVSGKIFIDAGSSTGGFTHFLLLHGARAVHAVDVGYNQLDYRLRNDPRVIVHERTNIQSLSSLDPGPHAAVGDLSFRSLRGVVGHILSLTQEEWGVFLLKPQFEITDPAEDFCGVVHDAATLKRTLQSTLLSLAEESIRTEAMCAAGIRGRKGNQEYMVLLRRDGSGTVQERSGRVMHLVHDILTEP
ncbi:SAM-dependent methyltransferase [Marispirochaeta sp.]|uniref:TlyA family RNA methyltransferase n=1 Tax=Marispirochaeta sp. TaxID=2038653 RepID=UPI0029C91BEA|nr:SAM-dependent methyltransferase [Marispirochaeta sp.]